MKRILAIVLALVMALALCACGSKPAAENTKTPEAPAQSYPLLVKSGEEVSADLDGDGTADTVCYTMAGPTAEGVGTDTHIGGLTINGKDFTEKVYEFGYYSFCPHEEYAITDIDKNDGKLEIALMDFGPSDDLVTGFFRYDGKDLSYLGTVSGVMDAGEYSSLQTVTFDGEGTVHSFVRLTVLQTWFADADWLIGSDGKFALVPQDMYYPLTGMTYPVKAITEVTSYASNDTGAEKTTLPAGSDFNVVGTDNTEWVLCKNADGSDFWLHLGEDGQSIETPQGVQISSLVLDGLVFAD